MPPAAAQQIARGLAGAFDAASMHVFSH